MATKKHDDLILSSLAADEKDQLLDELLEHHPELRHEAAQLAARRLGSPAAVETEEEIGSALDNLSGDDLASRAGKHRWGYVEPTDAAWQMVEECLEPYLDDIRRRASLGYADAARSIVLSVLAALHQRRDPPEGSVLGWASDAADELARTAVDTATSVGIELGDDALDQAWPGWHCSG